MKNFRENQLRSPGSVMFGGLPAVPDMLIQWIWTATFLEKQYVQNLLMPDSSYRLMITGKTVRNEQGTKLLSVPKARTPSVLW